MAATGFGLWKHFPFQAPSECVMGTICLKCGARRLETEASSQRPAAMGPSPSILHHLPASSSISISRDTRTSGGRQVRSHPPLDEPIRIAVLAGCTGTLSNQRTASSSPGQPHQGDQRIPEGRGKAWGPLRDGGRGVTPSPAIPVSPVGVPRHLRTLGQWMVPKLQHIQSGSLTPPPSHYTCPKSQSF